MSAHAFIVACGIAWEEVNLVRAIHFGSYWMGENDIVALMANDLRQVAESMIVDTELYSGRPSAWIDSSYDHRPEAKAVNWLADDKVKQVVHDFRPDLIICNAGGMSPTPEMHRWLRSQGIKTVGIALSDPDVFPTQGRFFAGLFDLIYTNAQVSLDQYTEIGVCAKLLPFAASPDYHKPMPELNKRYDVIIVGHARPDREEIVAELDKHFSVGLYGKGWKKWGIIPRGHQVNGKQQVRALNSGRTYISFSKTVAGYINVKVGLFEAIACGTPVFTEYFPEMENYFAYDDEIVGYKSLDELVSKLSHYLACPEQLAELAERGRIRLLKDHTWTRRWEQVLSDVNTLSRG